MEKVKRNAVQNLFSILIPSWNNLPYLQLCIKGIKKNSIHSHQIIVHVNEGKDGTLEWIKSQSDIDYTHSSENIGICYALNYSATLASTNYILYLNDDMYTCPGWDEALKKEIETIGHNFFFLSGTMIEPYDKLNPCVILKNYGTDIDSFNEKALLNEYELLNKTDWSGATFPPNIVHKDIWDMVGGYSIEFHPGMYSDPDFSMKLWKLGVRLFKGVGQCKVYHFSGQSTDRVKKNKGYYTFIQKWGFASSLLTQQYLKLGKEYSGLLTQPETGFYVKVKNLFKRLSASFNS